MNGHTIVGDGTTAQLTAMLTGIPEKEQPEARRGFANTGPVDRWKFIFNDLHAKNYMTMLSEDVVGISTFNFRLNGFKKQPTTSYTRPLWIGQDGVLKKQFSCPHKFHFKYLRDFFDANVGYNKMGFVHNNIMHGEPRRTENMDQDTVDFLRAIQKSVHGTNTVVLFMADHVRDFEVERCYNCWATKTKDGDESI